MGYAVASGAVENFINNRMNREAANPAEIDFI